MNNDVKNNLNVLFKKALAIDPDFLSKVKVFSD